MWFLLSSFRLFFEDLENLSLPPTNCSPAAPFRVRQPSSLVVPTVAIDAVWCSVWRSSADALITGSFFPIFRSTLPRSVFSAFLYSQGAALPLLSPPGTFGH